MWCGNYLQTNTSILRSTRSCQGLYYSAKIKKKRKGKTYSDLLRGDLILDYVNTHRITINELLKGKK